MGSSSKGFFGGFILGGIIGAILGYLLAPRGGEKAGETLKARLRDIVAQGRETLREAIEEGKEAAARKEAELRKEWGEKE